MAIVVSKGHGGSSDHGSGGKMFLEHLLYAYLLPDFGAVLALAIVEIFQGVFYYYICVYLTPVLGILKEKVGNDVFQNEYGL